AARRLEGPGPAGVEAAGPRHPSRCDAGPRRAARGDETGRAPAADHQRGLEADRRQGGRVNRPLRLASYNVEWFNALFDDRGRLHEDGQPSARYGISRGEQVGALGIVFSAMDADGVMI